LVSFKKAHQLDWLYGRNGAQPLLSREGLGGVWNLLLNKWRPDIARADAIACDTEGRKLECHCLGQPHKAMLGRDISDLER
jgi:hypothetical protein